MTGRDSWERLGFRVVTVNAASECRWLDDAPGLASVIVERDAGDIAGKPLIYFDDLLSSAARMTDGIFGIINADIILDAGPDFVAYIEREARGGMVMGCRTDVRDADWRRGAVYTEGFDYFFMDASVVSAYPESVFCMGVPWWDYWAALAPILRGISVKWLVTPVAYHVRHQTAWNNALHIELGRALFRQLRDDDFVSGHRVALDAERFDESDLYRYSRHICRFIRDHAAHVFYPNTPHLDKMAVIGLSHYRELVRHAQSASAIAASESPRVATGRGAVLDLAQGLSRSLREALLKGRAWLRDQEYKD